MLRRITVIVALVVMTPSLEGHTDAPPRRDWRIEALVSDAASLPPEFSADTLIRIAGSGRVTDRRWKRELLDEAFMHAYGAVAQYRRTGPRVPLESRQFAEIEAEDTPLARVALQSRAAQLMASVAPARARELFEWIDLNLAPARCEEVLVPAVDEYYTTASLIARTTFNGDRGEALRFLEYYLWRAHLPVEFPAVALAVGRFRANQTEAQQLEGFIESLMNGATIDPRSCSSATIDIIGRVADLQYADKQKGLPNWYLMDALRTYLVKTLAGPRCSDSPTESVTPSTYNMALRLLHAEKFVDAIDDTKIRPKQILAGAPIDYFWQTAESRRLFQAWMALRGSDSKLTPERVRRTDEWRDKALGFLVDVDRWTGRSESSERDFFYEKATLYANIIGLMPPSSARRRGLDLFADFLRHQDTDRSKRTLWFVFVNRMLEFSRGDGRQDVLEVMESSGHPVLAVYAQLERLLPQGTRQASSAAGPATN